MANESQKELNKLLREIQDKQLAITENQSRYNNKGKLGVNAQKELNKLKEREADLQAHILSLKEKDKQKTDDVGLSLVEQFKTAKLIAGAEKARVGLLKNQQASLSEIGSSLVKGNVAEALNLVTGRRVLDATFKRVSLYDDLMKNMKDEANFSDLSGKNQIKLRELLKGVNDGMFQRADIQAQINDIEEDSGIKIDNINGKMQDLLKLVNDEGEAQERVAQKMQDFNRALGQATLGFGPLLALLVSFSGTIDEIGNKFGSLVGYSDEFKGNLLDSQVEVTKLGGGIADVASITNTLASDFGVTLLEASELSSAIFDTSKALGLSSDEATKLIGNFMQISNLSASQSERLAESTFQLARQSGVAPQAVMQDIAGSTEAIANFTKDGGENIAEAAVQARRMGLSLDTAAKIAEGLLDFESSIAGEVEASVLLGRQLNFQKARELSLNNDIAGATAEIVKQLGSEEEFNNLNLIQRQALAKSIGVSTAELAKMVGQTEKLTLAGALATGSFTDLLGEEGLSNLSVLTGQIKSLGVEIANTFGPVLNAILPVVTYIFGVFGDLVGVLNDMGAVLPIVGLALGVLAGKLLIAAKAAFTEAYMKGISSIISSLKNPLLFIPAIVGFGGMMLAQSAQAKSFDNLGETSFAQAISPKAFVQIEGGTDSESIIKTKPLENIINNSVDVASQFGAGGTDSALIAAVVETGKKQEAALIKLANASENRTLKSNTTIQHGQLQIATTEFMANGTPGDLA